MVKNIKSVGVLAIMFLEEKNMPKTLVCYITKIYSTLFIKKQNVGCLSLVFDNEN